MSRITSGSNFIPEIDGLRFIAIFPVVMLHLLGTFIVVTKKMEVSGIVDWKIAAANSWLVHLISHGNYGVQLFFIISGFILALPFARKHFGISQGPKLKSYYLRRLSRLEPTYIINLSIILIIFVYVWDISPITIASNFFASLFYMHNQIFSEVSRISDVTWSLEVEVQFYILAPLLSTVFAIKNKYIRRSVTVCAIVIFSHMSGYTNPRLSLSLINYIHYFLCGFLLVDIFLSEWKEKPHKSFYGDIIGITGAILFFCFIFEILQAKIILPFSMVLIFVGIFKGFASNYIFTRKPLVIIGGMCYTIYLYHNIIINLTLPKLVALFPGTSNSKEILSGFLLVVIVIVPIVLIVCSVLFSLFERPFMKKEWYKIKSYKTVTVSKLKEVSAEE